MFLTKYRFEKCCSRIIFEQNTNNIIKKLIGLNDRMRGTKTSFSSSSYSSSSFSLTASIIDFELNIPLSACLTNPNIKMNKKNVYIDVDG